MTPIKTPEEQAAQSEQSTLLAAPGGRRGRRLGARLSRQQKAELLARFEDSGMSASRFARRAGVSSSSLLRWRRRCATTPASSQPASGFARVQMAEEPGCREPLVLHLQRAGLSVTLPAGTDALWLGRLLGCLQQGGAS